MAPRDYYKISRLPAIPAEDNLPGRISASDTEGDLNQSTFLRDVQESLTGTQFQEIHRESLLSNGALPPIGTRLAMERGRFHVANRGDEKALPVPPPEGQIAEKPTTPDSDHSASERAPSTSPLGVGTRRSRITFASTTKSEQGRISMEPPRWSKAHTPSPEQLQPLPEQDIPKDLPLPSGHQAPIRPVSGVTIAEISSTYADIREYRIHLRHLNTQVVEMQAGSFENMMAGRKILGYILIGRGVSKIPGSVPIEGMAREDVDWNELESVPNARSLFWVESISAMLIAAILCESSRQATISN